MYKLIKEGKFQFPDAERHGIEMSEDAKDIITKLLIKNKKKRLGSKDDIKEILAHPFFSDINIDKLLRKELEPPYKPELGEDLRFFD